jgi:nucleotide-binding universal stress UspA family protein
MNEEGTGLLERVLLPVSDGEDARATCTALAPYGPEHVTVLHVVEKGEGVPDKTPVEQSEEIAAEAFAAARETFPDADTNTAYARDVVAAILETARETDASAVVFRPRDSGLLARLFGGDRTLRLVSEADRPVVTLPDPEGGDA